MSGGLDRLRELIASEGGLLAADLRDEPAQDAGRGLGELAAAGPHAGRDTPLLLEAAREGYLLHAGRPRIFSGADRDLALLAGDRCYAHALEPAAADGDLVTVRVLADAISLAARARSEQDERLAELVWEAAALELGWGPDDRLSAARASVRAGESGAVDLIAAAIDSIRQEAGPLR